MVLGLGRHTLTGCLTTQGRAGLDWSADYRGYSAQRLEPTAIFDAVLKEVLAARDSTERVWLALDDSTLRKRGRKIPLTAWRRDPLSPPFAINFQWGHRVLQSSLLWPEASGGARALPMAFEILLNRPSKKERQRGPSDALREAERQANVNHCAVRQLQGLAAKIAAPLVSVVDGRFANRTFLRHLPPGCSAVARLRKDAALFHPPPQGPSLGRPRLYGPRAPTPEALRQDPSQPWQRVHAYAAGRDHPMKIKTLEPLRSALSGGTEGRLIVIAPLGYRLHAGGKLLYRQPAYLWVTDRTLTLEQAVQGYIWRWEEEVNFRDEKTLLGVGQAQVRHPQSVQRVPAMQVAAYSALLWSAQTWGGTDHGPGELPLPKWRRQAKPTRASTGRLINQLRHDTWAAALQPETLSRFWSASPATQKPEKLPTSLASALFYATG
jgi:hypothetical protein